MDNLISNAKILVTGGAGFIGSNLAEALLEQGNTVTVLDNFATGKPENLLRCKEFDNFRLITGDIRDLDTCKQAAAGQDYILHQAALGSVPRSIADPVTSTAVNILGFVNMLHAAVDAKVRRFVYASSSSTYGDSPVLPKVEERIGKPLSPYAITKYVNELYADNFHQLYGIDTIGMRYFNVFGPKQSPDSTYAAVIPRFAQKLLQGTSPVINGDGDFSRDFTYVQNVVQVNNLALVTENPEALNQVYNVACGERTTLNQLFGYLREDLAAHKPAIAEIPACHGPVRAGDIPHSLAAIDKAQRLLGYKPEVTVRQGIRYTADWYYHNLFCAK